jgi:hypothetical protein
MDTIPTPPPAADKNPGPIDYLRECDLDNETPLPSQWRSYLIRLLCWWPEDDE